jgi:hypothetical protein
MSDAVLAEALQSIKALESAALDAYVHAGEESERDQAITVRRHATATRKSIEAWIGVRAMRAQFAGVKR